MKKKRESQQLAFDELSRAQLEKIQEEVETFQEKQTQELKTLKAEAVALWKKDDSHAHHLGEVLLKIKALLPHGEFKKWWTEAKFSQARVSYCMRQASGKVKKAKDERKKSKRSQALSSIGKKLAKLYDFCEAGKAQEAKELFTQIKDDIENRIMSIEPKEKVESKKSMTAAAGK